MADFYVKYGSNDADLVGYYKCGNVNIRLHKLKDGRYVVSKNRRVLATHRDVEMILACFRNAIFLETPDSLFNSQN